VHLVVCTRGACRGMRATVWNSQARKRIVWWDSDSNLQMCPVMHQRQSYWEDFGGAGQTVRETVLSLQWGCLWPALPLPVRRRLAHCELTGWTSPTIQWKRRSFVTPISGNAHQNWGNALKLSRSASIIVRSTMTIIFWAFTFRARRYVQYTTHSWIIWFLSKRSWFVSG
jgi:hypothetical protein